MLGFAPRELTNLYRLNEDDLDEIQARLLDLDDLDSPAEIAGALWERRYGRHLTHTSPFCGAAGGFLSVLARWDGCVKCQASHRAFREWSHRWYHG